MACIYHKFIPPSCYKLQQTDLKTEKEEIREILQQKRKRITVTLMRFLRLLTAVGFFLGLIQVLGVSPIFAVTTPYLVTPGFVAPPPSVIGVGRVLFSKSLSAAYPTGYRVLLSRNPDGTGSADVGDAIQAIANFRTFTFNAYAPLCAFRFPMPPQDITWIFNPGNNNVLVRYLDWCGGTKTMSPLYLVVTDVLPTPTPTPSPTPTPAPTPTPTPAPFLDLPWNYEEDGLTFTEAALAINSYFDHEYPLLSSGLGEPMEIRDSVTYFKGKRRDDLDYSLHDGYDYGLLAKVAIDDSVLAAAPGWASYVNTCGACGNMIVIDHENGYQTRYLHLQKDGLITTNTNDRVWVDRGQAVGEVGATGNSDGAHIHFGVFQDKNHDGNFEDNVPDGVTDPFGWQSTDPDPWETYLFVQNEIEKSGNKSFYLWLNRLEEVNNDLTPEGGIFTAGRFNAIFPPGVIDQIVHLSMLAGPTVNPSASLSSVGSSIDITLKDTFGNIINQLLAPFTLIVDFSTFDISRFKPETLSIYSSSDGRAWNQEPTIIDWNQKTAASQVSHLTQFALVGERKDTTAPTTTARLVGAQGSGNWLRSAVQVYLDAVDNPDGLGVAYTLYRIGEEEKQAYSAPLSFFDEGHHTISFHSVDNDENIETAKTISFDIDKIPPEAILYFDTSAPQLIVQGYDSNIITIEKSSETIRVIDMAGNTLTLTVSLKELHNEAELSISTLQYNDDPPISLDVKLRAHYVFDPPTGSLIKLSQTYKENDELKLTLDYDAQTNATKVVTKEKEADKTKEIFDGLRSLQMKTNEGTLEYRY